MCRITMQINLQLFISLYINKNMINFFFNTKPLSCTYIDHSRVFFTSEEHIYL